MSRTWLASIVWLGGVLIPLGLAAQGQTFATDDLVGRWGVASYSKPADQARVLREAQAACGSPYVINRGRNGGAIMFEALAGRPLEVSVTGRRIAPMDEAASKTAKEVISWNGRVLELRYSDADIAPRYGTMVFARCGR